MEVVDSSYMDAGNYTLVLEYHDGTRVSSSTLVKVRSKYCNY